MPENRSRYVLLCQQVLAFGTVAALAAPATSVVTLDIVAPAPPHVTGGATAPSADGSLVASEPVAPDVTEVPVTGIERAGLKALTNGRAAQPKSSAGQLRLAAADGAKDGQELAALTAPEPVSGYATVGVTWKHGEVVDDEEITVSVRSLRNGSWSGWEEIEYHDEHAPDPGSEEASRARPGTDPLVVGNVDEVQVKAETATGEVPADMKLAVVDPGETADPVVEKPAIDTADLGADDVAALSSADVSAGTDPNAPDPGTTEPGTTDPGTTDPGSIDDGTVDEGVLAGNPADVTPKPKIYSRAQWGADERMRDKSSLHYYEIHAGFVHHTVNANSYTRSQVPSLLRGIYAYHTQSKGWSDIGYNFIVDRFGRIWEGRYGGVARPVVGAHTLGYNEYSFAMSALGNFETARPSSALLDAYGRLFAWKLSLHGIDASSTRQWVGKKYFRAINGHRDAGQTACPGRYLYAKLPTIRSLAAGYQKPFSSRAKTTNLSGSHWPDLVVRDKATKRAYLVRTAGQVDFRRGKRVGGGWNQMNLITPGRDLTGDGIGDMVGRIAATGITAVYPGSAQGTFGAAVGSTARFSALDQVTGVGDMSSDGKNDLVARNPETKVLYIYPGTGRGTFRKRRVLSRDWSAYKLTTGVGDMTGDGKNDLLTRDGDNRLWLVPGAGTRSIGTPVRLPHAWGTFDLVTGMGDVTNDGRPDIVARKRTSKLTYIYPGDGHGGIGHPYGPFTRFEKTTFLASAGQVAGDGRADMVGRVGSQLRVFTNTGGKNIGSMVRTNSVFLNTDLVLNVGDWNGDGHGDVMTRKASNGRMFFRAGDGRSGFAAPVLAGKGWDRVNLVAAVGDVTGDGFPDLMGQPRGAGMRIYPGNGGTGFGASYVAHSSISSNDQVGAGLWNSDGSPDSILRRTDGSLMFYPGNGPGGLMNPSKIGGAAGRFDWIQGVGDADGDGYPDLIARQRADGELWLLPGNGSGFGTSRYIGSGFGRFDLSG
jgi:hypothetical protein